MSNVGKFAALELISWRPHLSLERACRRRFSRRGREVTAKKCPKKNLNTCANLLNKPIAVLTFSLPSPSSSLKLSFDFLQSDN